MRCTGYRVRPEVTVASHERKTTTTTTAITTAHQSGFGIGRLWVCI
jgi:hypothetical protein